MTNTNCAAADELSSLTFHLQGGLTRVCWCCIRLPAAVGLLLKWRWKIHDCKMQKL
ncbi:hypothetical protein SRHO_G00286320 [Serrasalmus rhombeus]